VYLKILDMNPDPHGMDADAQPCLGGGKESYGTSQRKGVLQLQAEQAGRHV